MATYKIFKETALPGTLAPNAIYLVAPAAVSGYLEIYATNSAGDAQRHTPTQAEIQALIDASLASATGGAVIVDDITARDALTPDNGQIAYVIDATDDGTVSSGGATYIYRSSNTTWIKQSEAESLDLTVTWASITGKPSSSTADIDDAVAKKHAHANKTQLDKIDEDGDGVFTYDSVAYVQTGSTAW